GFVRIDGIGIGAGIEFLLQTPVFVVGLPVFVFVVQRHHERGEFVRAVFVGRIEVAAVEVGAFVFGGARDVDIEMFGAGEVVPYSDHLGAQAGGDGKVGQIRYAAQGVAGDDFGEAPGEAILFAVVQA